MKTMKFMLIGLVMALALGLTGVVMAADPAVVFTLDVNEINSLSVTDEAITLTVDEAVAGSAPTAVPDSSSTYAITTNGTSKRITGQLNTIMPTGVTLTANLTAPSGSGSSAGTVAMIAASATSLVTGISGLNESSLGITYELSATSAAAVIGAAISRTLTLTIAAAE
jgi:hypothetical protein